jgi:transcriptional regulator with PAS, ATPase and Fis domain
LNDYFAAPFDWNLIRISLEQFFPRPNHSDNAWENLVDGSQLAGKSAFVQSVKRQISRIAPSPSNVLITGETGTGKEVVAHLIHSNSPRAPGPFVCINCAAIPESLVESELFGYERGAFTGAASAHAGLLRQAATGTVLLDEIGELSLASQIKLLRVIETRQLYPLGSRHASVLDARFIAATNQPLEQLINEKRFRKDLYFRLNVSRIELSPLRERRDDILPLIERFIAEFNRNFGREIQAVAQPAVDILLAHAWPGNVRELRNVIESMFVVSSDPHLMLDDLPEYLLREPGNSAAARTSEKDLLVSALRTTSWNKSEAARLLRWSRMTVYRKIKEYRIEDVTAAS